MFIEVLSLVGLTSSEVVYSGSGLRELTLATSPALRVLFGLDFAARRLLAILGEALDRNYYGDSVRFAERRWNRYLSAAASPHTASRR